MPHPVRDLADYSHGLPGAVGPGRISGKLFVRYVRVILQRALRLHNVDATSAFAFGQLGSPHGGIQGLRHIDVVRDTSSAPNWIKGVEENLALEVVMRLTS